MRKKGVKRIVEDRSKKPTSHITRLITKKRLKWITANIGVIIAVWQGLNYLSTEVGGYFERLNSKVENINDSSQTLYRACNQKISNIIGIKGKDIKWQLSFPAIIDAQQKELSHISNLVEKLADDLEGVIVAYKQLGHLLTPPTAKAVNAYPRWYCDLEKINNY